MNKPRWDDESLEYFKNNYFATSNIDLAKTLGRSVPSLIGMAQRLGLKKNNQFRRSSDCSILLNKSKESMYWIGFILADGHISALGRMKVATAEKDYDHLNGLATYISSGIRCYGKEHPYYEVNVMDKDVIPQLAERYQISSTKTYNPPNLRSLNLTDTEIMCMLIGFIDGDGSRESRKEAINIKCHASWEDTLAFFSESLQRISGITSRMMPRIIGSGYAKLSISNSKLVTYLSSYVSDNNLPVLRRKWP